MKNIRTQVTFALFVTLLALVASLPISAHAQGIADTQSSMERSAQPDWLEPRGLSVLDLVGQAPEGHLRGSIVVFSSAGVTRYLRGQRTGDTVTIEVSMSTFENPAFTELPCLGRRPLFDEWPVSVPSSEMRVFSGGVDVTSQVIGAMWLYPAAVSAPARGSGSVERYSPNTNTPVARTAAGALIIPANMGCVLYMAGSIPNLTAEFVFDYPQQILVEPLGSQTFDFFSYIGPGNAGSLGSLSDQLQGRYPDRHDKFALQPPAGADYIWLNYPPTPVSPYAGAGSNFEHNVRLPSSGTYRLIGVGDTKSVDHVVSMGLPLAAQWIDSGLRGDSWLERTNPIELVSAPEYFVPPGVPYHPCMKDGGCSSALLDQIHNTSAQMTLHYYRVRRLRSSNLMNVPLRQVGPDWNAAAAAMTPGNYRVAQAQPATAPGEPSNRFAQPSQSLYLPFVYVSTPPATFPDDPPQEGCPCGWFDQNFRLLDVIPGS